MALAADRFIVTPGAQMSIVAVASRTKLYTLTQSDQGTSKSHLQTERAIRFLNGGSMVDTHTCAFDHPHSAAISIFNRIYNPIP
jgi:hypothetical protein